MSDLRIDYPHKLPDEEARERVKALGDYLQNKHGIGVTWGDADHARVSGRYLVVSIEGSVALSPGLVVFQGKDPGFLWRGKAKDYLQAKLRKYLDPSVALDTLPRR
jgi:hypothetical protein